MSKIVAIFGSSSSNGKTFDALKDVSAKIKAKTGETVKIIDLKKANLTTFDYEGNNSYDDFSGIMRQMIEADRVIFATPVYWYCPSTYMKAFLDRWSDILLGRYPGMQEALVGKKIFVLATQGAPTRPRGFDDIWQQICEYMKMSYQGCYYVHTGNTQNLLSDNDAQTSTFVEKICE